MPFGRGSTAPRPRADPHLGARPRLDQNDHRPSPSTGWLSTARMIRTGAACWSGAGQPASRKDSTPESACARQPRRLARCPKTEDRPSKQRRLHVPLRRRASIAIRSTSTPAFACASTSSFPQRCTARAPTTTSRRPSTADPPRNTLPEQARSRAETGALWSDRAPAHAAHVPARRAGTQREPRPDGSHAFEGPHAVTSAGTPVARFIQISGGVLAPPPARRADVEELLQPWRSLRSGPSSSRPSTAMTRTSSSTPFAAAAGRVPVPGAARRATPRRSSRRQPPKERRPAAPSREGAECEYACARKPARMLSRQERRRRNRTPHTSAWRSPPPSV